MVSEETVDGVMVFIPKKVKTGIDAITDPEEKARTLFRVQGSSKVSPYSKRLRASSLHVVCVRAQILGYRNGLVHERRIFPNLQFTLDIGTAVHHLLQNHPKYLSGTHLGWWRCMSCGRTVFGKRQVTPCLECKTPYARYEYVEHELEMDYPFLFSGHVDDILEVYPSVYRVCDYKSMGSAEFKTLTKPKDEHKLQVSAYQVGLKYDKTLPIKVDEEVGYVLYVSKEMIGKGFPMKLFEVNSQTHRDIVVDMLTEHALHMNNDTYPDVHKDCLSSHFMCAKARNCPTKDICKQKHEDSRH